MHAWKYPLVVCGAILWCVFFAITIGSFPSGVSDALVLVAALLSGVVGSAFLFIGAVDIVRGWDASDAQSGGATHDDGNARDARGRGE